MVMSIDIKVKFGGLKAVKLPPSPGKYDKDMDREGGQL